MGMLRDISENINYIRKNLYRPPVGLINGELNPNKCKGNVFSEYTYIQAKIAFISNLNNDTKLYNILTSRNFYMFTTGAYFYLFKMKSSKDFNDVSCLNFLKQINNIRFLKSNFNEEFYNEIEEVYVYHEDALGKLNPSKRFKLQYYFCKDFFFKVNFEFQSKEDTADFYAKKEVDNDCLYNIFETVIVKENKNYSIRIKLRNLLDNESSLKRIKEGLINVSIRDSNLKDLEYYTFFEDNDIKYTKREFSIFNRVKNYYPEYIVYSNDKIVYYYEDISKFLFFQEQGIIHPLVELKKEKNKSILELYELMFEK